MRDDTAPDLYAAMQLPPAARLDERMAKHLFYQQPKFTRRDEALFTKDIERITLRYALTPETTHLAPYRDDVRDYGDVLVLEIALRSDARRQRIAELFWQYLPRPQVLIFEAGERYALALALVRTNLADRTRNTVEESLSMDGLAATDDIWTQLAYPTIPATDFYQLVRGAFDRMSAEKARRELGCTGLDGAAARKALARDAALAQEIAELRAQMKKELPFQRKAELNMKIKRIEQQRKTFHGGGRT